MPWKKLLTNVTGSIDEELSTPLRQSSSLIPFGKRALHHVLKEYAANYHFEHNHQGIGNNFIIPLPGAGKCTEGATRCRERLGGLLKFYHRGVA